MTSDPRIGAILQGRYRIVAQIAQGGMGVVYRGERIGLDRPVAIKFLQDSVLDRPDGLHRFQVEARAASRLGHPNCVAVIDFGVERGSPYLVMDHAFGRTLRTIIDDERLTVPRALELGRQVLAGLAHAHDKGITYRDVKPENVVVAPDEVIDEHARILDFGLAKITGALSITDGVAIGTPSYMSPEQTIGLPADARSDVYGAGVLLFELLTGKKPFTSTDTFELMRMHREEPVPAFADVAPDRKIPPELEAVIRRALAKSPLDRYPTAAQLAAAIDRAVAEAEPAAIVATPVFGPRMWLTLAAALLGAFVAGLAFAWLAPQRSGGEPERPPPASAAPTPPATTPSEPVIEPPEPGTAVIEDIPGVAEAIALARAGQPVQAQAALEALQRKHKGSAYVSYALGVVSALRGRWTAAVDAYGDALRANSAYRTDPQLVTDLVHSLASERAADEAAALIVRFVGEAALPALDELQTPDPELRARIQRVRGRLTH